MPAKAAANHSQPCRLVDASPLKKAQILQPKAILAHGTETILLVDDESLIRDLGERILTQFGYSVITAADGESALSLYRGNKDRISLVILDLNMPGMGGRQCLESLVATDPGVKVIIASGYSTNGLAAEAIKTGACGFLGKPFKLKQMLGVVRQTLDA